MSFPGARWLARARQARSHSTLGPTEPYPGPSFPDGFSLLSLD
jgi:hypothetical protein